MSEVFIEVQGLELRGFHGATTAEQKEGQLFFFDVMLVAHDAGIRTDQLADTIDYTKVVECVREVSDSHRQPDRGAGCRRGGHDPRALRRLPVRVRVQARGRAGGSAEHTSATVERVSR